MSKYLQIFITASALLLMAGTADAIEYDLSFDGAMDQTIMGGTTGGEAIFSQYTAIPAGTGYIDPFVRIQPQGYEHLDCPAGQTCEQAYNTDYRPVQFDTKDQNDWTKSLLLSDLVNPDSDSVQFLLDINQDNGGGGEDKYLSLDELQFFVTADPNLHNYDDATNMFTSGAELVWDLDNPMTADDWIKLNNYLGDQKCGSGDFELSVEILYEDFVAAADRLGIDVADAHVVLFSRFGDNAGLGSQSAGANDGFEEWSGVLFAGDTQVPEPGMVSLLFVGMVGVWAIRRRRKTA